MSVDQTKVVDFIGVDKRTGEVNLTIVDTLDWTHEEDHLTQLQEKLNAYLRFIESGEINQAYPDAIGKKRRIQIFAQHEPTTRGFEFLKYAQQSIEHAGFGFHFQVGPPEEEMESHLKGVLLKSD